MKVPFFDYARLSEFDYPIYKKKLDEVLMRSDFIMRSDHFEFENALASYMKSKHCLGVANGTDAIWLSLMASDVKPGDEVILPSHTYVATADSVHLLGAIPVLVDVGPDHLIDPAAIEEAINERTSAVIAVNLNGQTAQLDLIRAIADKYQIRMIEDNAQGLGAYLDGKSSGTFGDFGTLSFFPAKNLGGIGDGGGITTQDDELAKRIYLLRNHGRDQDLEVRSWGVNSRLDNLQAAILHEKLKVLDASLDRRRDIAKRYCEEFSKYEEICLPASPNDDQRRISSFQNFEIEVEEREKFVDFLSQNGIGTSKPWGGKAVHHFNLPGIKLRDLSCTESLFSRILLLPMNQYLFDEEIDHIVSVIHRYFEQK